MNNIILGRALAITILVILSACGGGGATPTPTEAPSTDVPTEVVEETETAAEPTVADGATEEAASETAEPVTEGTTVTVNFTNTNARSGPGTAFESLGPVRIGAALPVIARSDGPDIWYLVTLENGDTGWLWGRVVTLNPREAEVEVAATVPSPP